MIESPKEFIDKAIQWMVSHQQYCGNPTPFSEITDDMLEDSWVYDREVGFFYVHMGYHVFVRSILYGLRHYNKIRAEFEILKRPEERFIRFFMQKYNIDCSKWSELWMEEKGTAYVSGVGPDVIKVGSHINLNRMETLKLGKFWKIMTVEDCIKGLQWL